MKKLSEKDVEEAVNTTAGLMAQECQNLVMAEVTEAAGEDLAHLIRPKDIAPYIWVGCDREGLIAFILEKLSVKDD